MFHVISLCYYYNDCCYIGLFWRYLMFYLRMRRIWTRSWVSVTWEAALGLRAALCQHHLPRQQLIHKNHTITIIGTIVISVTNDRWQMPSARSWNKKRRRHHVTVALYKSSSLFLFLSWLSGKAFHVQFCMIIFEFLFLFVLINFNFWCKIYKPNEVAA